MKERLLIAFASIATLICAASLFYVMYQTNRTRISLQDDGIDIFNYTMQNDRNTDAYAYALMDYKSNRAQATEPASKAEYIERFDILWSAFRAVDGKWLGSHGQAAQTQEVIRSGRLLVSELEGLMSVDVSLTNAQIDTAALRARQLSDSISDLGALHYQNASILRDRIFLRMDNLNSAFWLLGSFLILSFAALLGLLTRATWRESALLKESRSTQLQLTTAIEELRSGDVERKAQNRFIAAASHDLRQPLHALGLYLSALPKHVKSNTGTAILANVNRSTEALSQLLNSLLDISKLDAGVVTIEQRSFALDALFEQLHQSFVPDAEARKLALDVHLSGLCVHSDRVLLDRILRNLISNAVTYTPKGSVTLSASLTGDMVLICVEDTGFGIPENEQQAIFNEYYQLHNPERDRTKGLGLGLSIVRRLTRLLDINLKIQSEVGKGTRFELIAWPGSMEFAETIKDGSLKVVDTIPLQGLTILVIDDERDVREGMETLMGQMGCRVITADSALGARQQLIESEIVPDLIIADYRLPNEQTGDVAIQQVREELNEDVPAMIITGDTSPARLREATASGFKLLHKPVVADELFSSIRQLVQG